MIVGVKKVILPAGIGPATGNSIVLMTATTVISAEKRYRSASARVGFARVVPARGAWPRQKGSSRKRGSRISAGEEETASSRFDEPG